jgi:hypothetical protein
LVDENYFLCLLFGKGKGKRRLVFALQQLEMAGFLVRFWERFKIGNRIVFSYATAITSLLFAASQ